jgi:hypothetical protein
VPDAYHELIREERSKARGSIYDARATLAPEISDKRLRRCWRTSNQTHSEARSAAAARPFGARDEFHLAAIAQKLRKPAPLIRGLIRSTK